LHIENDQGQISTRKPRGQPRNSWVRTVTNDLANAYTGLPEAREAAQDRVYWRMFTKHSALAQRTRSGACSYWISLNTKQQTIIVLSQKGI